MENTSPPNEGKPLPVAAYLPSGDHVKTALVAGGATAPQLDTILWLLNHGREEKLGSITALAKRVNIDGGTLSKIFAGKYGADLDRMVAKFDHYRAVHAERRSLGDKVIVRDLRVVKDITDFCELTRVTQTMSILFGPNQSGKSWGLEKIYTPANNHGRTIYVSMLDSGGATRLFLQDILRACGISERKSYGEMKERIFRYFDPQTLLIVDEFHQTVIGRTLKMPTIEAVRAIFEKCGCGVVLCGTDVIPDMFDDPKFRKFLGQIGNRGVLRRLIPAKPYKEDVAAICKAYGFTWPAPEDQARELVKQISETNGIGKLCRYFQFSRRLANKRGETLAWPHFLDTLATLKSWERGEQMKEAK